MEGTTSKIYKNGGSLETADFSSCSRIADDSVLDIGRRGDGWSGSYFNGRIDEVRIHNRALDPSEFDLLPAGPTAPALVTDFNASDGENGQSTLTWTNPGDTDLAEVLVKRNTGSYPTDHTVGTTVYDNTSPTHGASVSYTNTGLTNDTTYYYAVFSKDTDNNWNDTVQAGSNADTGTPSTAGGPVGYWKFNEGSGSVAGDSSGLGNDGTIHGASWVSGSPDGSTALSFDGVSDYVEVADDSSLDITDAITIEAWIRPGVTFSTGSFYAIVSKYYNRSGYQLVWHQDGYLYFYVTNGIAVRSNVTTLSAGRWYHVAVTYQGGTTSGKIYLNGADITYSSSDRDRKSTRLNSSHTDISRMPSSA